MNATPAAIHATSAIPHNVRDLLKRDEGTVLHVYKDQYDNDTLGTGRMVDGRKGGGISAAEADILLDNDITKCTTALTADFPWFAQLDEVRKAVLISMAFQMGGAGLEQFVRTLAAIRYGKYGEAAADMRLSLWYSQTPERAERLAQMMADGQWK